MEWTGRHPSVVGEGVDQPMARRRILTMGHKSAKDGVAEGDVEDVVGGQ